VVAQGPSTAEPVLIVDHSADGVAVVTINRPHRLNAFDAILIAELPTVLEMLAADAAVRVVVVTGRGRGFCAGADLADHGLTATDPLEIEAWMRHVHRGAVALHDLPQVTIAAVNGAAAGGGLGLALGCDIRIASPDAIFTTAFPALGLGPDFGVSKLLPGAVGVATAMELLLTGRRVDAAEAQRIGMVNRIQEEPLAASVALAAEVAALPAGLARSIKQTVRQSLTMDFEAVLMDLESRAQASLIAARLGDGQSVGDLRRLRAIQQD
jgi:enoyl-CoA hydratase/carnithine racemase